MKWFRLYTEILDDPKIFDLTDFQFKTLILLMALASRLDKDGAIDLSEHGLRVSIHCPTPGLALSNCLTKLNKLGIISSPNLPFKFINWNKRQYKSDNSTTRVQKHRVMKRACNAAVTAMKRTVDTDTDTDTDRERERERESKESSGNSPHPPQTEAVKIYRETFHLNPNRIQQPAIDAAVKGNGNLVKWEKVCKAWALAGYRPMNIRGMLDWLKNGIPQTGKGAIRGKQTKDEAFAAVDRAMAKIEEVAHGKQRDGG